MKIYVDFEQKVAESNSNRFDNSITLPLVVGEKSSDKGESNSDDPLLYGPSHFLTLFVLVLFTVLKRKRDYSSYSSRNSPQKGQAFHSGFTGFLHTAQNSWSSDTDFICPLILLKF